MGSSSPGYCITIRVDGRTSAQPVSIITQVISQAGVSITALDVVESVLDRVVIDVTCDEIVFALGNPDPEINPELARKHAAAVATGRIDQPNQINNVLVFPGIFRGLLDAKITKATDEMLVEAANAIASCVSDEQLNANFIVPSVFDSTIVQRVAASVKRFA
jgi:malic enzyme